MTNKKYLLLISSFGLAFVTTLVGIWGNAQFHVLQNGDTLTAGDTSAGVALSGWTQTESGVWEFAFIPEQDMEDLTLCLAGGSVFESDQMPEAAGNSGELYAIKATAGQTLRLRLLCSREPQCWLSTLSRAYLGFEMRQILQTISLTAFITMGFAVLVLFLYKRQAELGCFLLYLVVLTAWSVAAALFPLDRSSGLQWLMRLFFSLAVIAPIWLSAALTRTKPPFLHGMRLYLFASVYLICSLSAQPWLRFFALMPGMFYCVYLLCDACAHGVAAAWMLLFPCSLTTGLRVWVLLPGLQVPFFQESFVFYLIRCARFYDLPFTLGCLAFVCRSFAIQFDRTEQLARELDLRVIERTRALTEEGEARKSMMLNIFHDLRSPLFAVSNGLEALNETPEALPALLPTLRQRVEFVHRLTEDLFLAAKLEQKQIMLNEDRVALNEAAAAVSAACRSEADAKGVSLLCDANAFLLVWGDEMRLEQVLQNLITNAIHYTPAGGQIEVVCSCSEKEALVSIRDTGCGIAPSDQSAVFDRYFHTTSNTKHDSTGLGLTIAQELAHLHHGEITLVSAVGEGSCFTLHLPLLE